MKKYSSGSFVAAAVRIYGSEADTITSFPASIIADGGNIMPWTITGNTSGGQSVGEKTANHFDESTIINGVIDQDGNIVATGGSYRTSDYIEVSSDDYTISLNMNVETARRIFVALYDATKTFISRLQSTEITTTGFKTYTFTVTTEKYIRICIINTDTNVMLNTGETALPFEPHGYKLPVVIGSTTTNIYMADVLRMSSGADPVYDIMSSTGVITRNVDTDGSPLPTPTTESFTAPTLATVAGSQSFTIDTTVKPSSVSLTYTGWHTHADKQYSGGQWGQVSTNAKKKKSVLGSRKASKGKT